MKTGDLCPLTFYTAAPAISADIETHAKGFFCVGLLYLPCLFLLDAEYHFWEKDRLGHAAAGSLTRACRGLTFLPVASLGLSQGTLRVAILNR